MRTINTAMITAAKAGMFRRDVPPARDAVNTQVRPPLPGTRWRSGEVPWWRGE
jgi:hypothetical protein